MDCEIVWARKTGICCAPSHPGMIAAANLPPNTVATPEGDNEYLPDEPLPTAQPKPERPRGDQPHSVEPLYPTD